MGKCPFTGLKKECTPKCELFMEVIRCYDDGREEIVKSCVFKLDHEERRNQTQRLAMMQSETGEMKQVALFSSVARLSDDPRAINELAKIVNNNMKKLPEGKDDGI